MKIKWLGCALLLPLAVLHAHAQSDFKLQPVGDRVWAAISSDTGKAFANAGFVIGDDGVLVVDTFQDPEPARQLLAEIRRITPLPVRFVVNTHYHIDHVNGDDVFAEAGAAIVAHRNVRPWMRKENFKFWPDPAPADVKARLESLTLPEVVYDNRMELYLGKRMIEVRYYPGHTGGDSVVFIPDANVVFCGDLLWTRHYPNLIDATTSSWVTTLAALEREHPAATFIPGHGEAGKTGDAVSFRQYLEELRAAVKQAQAQGKSGDRLVEAVLPSLRAKRTDWAFFDDYARDDITQTEQELAGNKRVPPMAAR
jgi:glyoxylase-like metal-dependent hydrolase (beta-lactamase superfamily II)